MLECHHHNNRYRVNISRRKNLVKVDDAGSKKPLAATVATNRRFQISSERQSRYILRSVNIRMTRQREKGWNKLAEGTVRQAFKHNMLYRDEFFNNLFFYRQHLNSGVTVHHTVVVPYYSVVVPNVFIFNYILGLIVYGVNTIYFISISRCLHVSTSLYNW